MSTGLQYPQNSTRAIKWLCMIQFPQSLMQRVRAQSCTCLAWKKQGYINGANATAIWQHWLWCFCHCCYDFISIWWRSKLSNIPTIQPSLSLINVFCMWKLTLLFQVCKFNQRMITCNIYRSIKIIMMKDTYSNLVYMIVIVVTKSIHSLLFNITYFCYTSSKKAITNYVCHGSTACMNRN